jgi:hypothetical protein
MGKGVSPLLSLCVSICLCVCVCVCLCLCGCVEPGSHAFAVFVQGRKPASLRLSAGPKVSNHGGKRSASPQLPESSRATRRKLGFNGHADNPTTWLTGPDRCAQTPFPPSLPCSPPPFSRSPLPCVSLSVSLYLYLYLSPDRRPAVRCSIQDITRTGHGS